MRTVVLAVLALTLALPAVAQAEPLRTLETGRFTATVTSTPEGERLTVYRARGDKRRRIASRRHLRGRFTRIILDRSGVAAYLAVRTLPSGRERVVVRTTDDPIAGRYDAGPDIDPRTLGFSGDVVLWRRAGNLRVRSVSEDTVMGGRGTLLREDGLRIDAASRTLRARLGDGPSIALGSADGACETPSGCGGVDALRRAGSFLAIREYVLNCSGGEGFAIADLATGRRRQPASADCVGAFVLVENGHAAWMSFEEVDPSQDDGPRVARIRTDRGALLDQGDGIDPASLRRRGNRLVWRHDGVERTAPLPR